MSQVWKTRDTTSWESPKIDDTAPSNLVPRSISLSLRHCNDHPTTTEQYDQVEGAPQPVWGVINTSPAALLIVHHKTCLFKDGLAYDVVVSAIDRQVKQEVDQSEYVALEDIGIDEISMKKGNQDYVTIVSVRTKQVELTVIVVLPGKLKETVLAFLQLIPKHLRRTVKTVCTDMCDGFVKAATEVFGADAVVVIVQQFFCKI